MVTGSGSTRRDPVPAGGWIAVMDVCAKVVLLLVLTRVALDPAWGNLEGKAPGTRAVTYPLLAFLVPLAYVVRRPAGPFPWLADLLVTVPAFSDVLGNRFDLYDQVTWFDDAMHVVNTGSLGAAAVILAGSANASWALRVTTSVAAGMTLAVAWEVWEYYAFVTRSAEVGTAYADTVGDLALGWLGTVAAGVLLGLRTGSLGRAQVGDLEPRPAGVPGGGPARD